MGSPDPRAYSRNKRGIAGSLIWINFDRHALLNLFYQAQGQFVADADELRPQYSNTVQPNGTAIFNSSIVRDAGPTINSTIDQLDVQEPITAIGSWTELATPWFSDQILPFDITLGAANEYGAMAAMKIFGVEILNEASGVSIDDSVTETQASFVARTIEGYRLRLSLLSPFCHHRNPLPRMRPILSVLSWVRAHFWGSFQGLRIQPPDTPPDTLCLASLCRKKNPSSRVASADFIPRFSPPPAPPPRTGSGNQWPNTGIFISIHSQTVPQGFAMIPTELNRRIGLP